MINNAFGNVVKKNNIYIIAPASSNSQANRVLDNAYNVFKGYNVSYNRNTVSKNILFFSDELKKRVDDFSFAVQSNNIDILWCFRGGYGSAEVGIKALQDNIKPSNNKILIGFSDITALHVLFNQKYNMPSIHGDHIYDIYKTPNKLKEIDKILKGDSLKYKLHPLNDEAKQNKIISTKTITGGNLKVLTTLIGTALHPDFDDKILILEDIAEKGYAIMRSLMHLKNAGLLDKVKAIIFGDFIKGDDYVQRSIELFVQEMQVPCFRIHDVGHGDINHPIIFGSKSEIKNNILNISNPFKK